MRAAQRIAISLLLAGLILVLLGWPINIGLVIGAVLGEMAFGWNRP